MRRGLWFGAGVAAGVYGMVRVRRVAEAFTPDGIRDRVRAAGVGARMLRDEVAQGTTDAESGLRDRFGVTSAESQTRALPPAPSQGAHRAELNPTNDPTNDQKDDR